MPTIPDTVDITVKFTDGRSYRLRSEDITSLDIDIMALPDEMYYDINSPSPYNLQREYSFTMSGTMHSYTITTTEE